MVKHIIFATIFILLSSTIIHVFTRSLQPNIIFEEIDPVVWVETDDGVDFGIKKVYLDISIVSPCSSSKPKEHNLDNITYSALEERCKTSYEEIVRASFKKFAQCSPKRRNLVKREPVTITIVGGALIVSLASGVTAAGYSWLSSGSSYNRLNQKDIQDNQQEEDIKNLYKLTNQTVSGLLEARELRKELIEGVSSNRVKIQENSHGLKRLRYEKNFPLLGNFRVFSRVRRASRVGKLGKLGSQYRVGK